jgi:hypothetical protein
MRRSGRRFMSGIAMSTAGVDLRSPLTVADLL